MASNDTYSSFAGLAEREEEGRDFKIVEQQGAREDVLIMAPHGGGIEPSTSDIARGIAGDEFSLYCFEGIKTKDNFKLLHVTSTNFDEPQCLAMLANADIVVAIHGADCHDSRLYIGGLDKDHGFEIARSLEGSGYSVLTEGHKYPGTEAKNICNRGRSKTGVQIEISYDLRNDAGHRGRIAKAIRAAL